MGATGRVRAPKLPNLFTLGGKSSLVAQARRGIEEPGRLAARLGCREAATGPTIGPGVESASRSVYLTSSVPFMSGWTSHRKK